MSLMMAVFVYFLIWWTMIFTTLPFGFQHHNEDDKGHQPGAPAKPNIKKKMLINTVLSFIVLGIIELLIRTGVVDFNAMFNSGDF